MSDDASPGRQASISGNPHPPQEWCDARFRAIQESISRLESKVDRVESRVTRADASAQAARERVSDLEQETTMTNAAIQATITPLASNLQRIQVAFDERQKRDEVADTKIDSLVLSDTRRGEREATNDRLLKIGLIVAPIVIGIFVLLGNAVFWFGASSARIEAHNTHGVSK
jgi:hypothetical protein